MGWLAAAAAIGGGALKQAGAHSANSANRKLAAENRAWQEKMSNTAYQRAARDMELAGLNRILALGHPATTPGGNVATMQNENEGLAEGMNSAISAKLAVDRQRQELKNMKANENLTVAQKNAIQPASTLGEALETSTEKLKKLDWGAMWDRLKQDISGAISRPKSDYDLSRIDNTAKGLGFNKKGSDRARRLFLQTISEMDTPPGMSDEEKLKWGLQNIDKVRRYLTRRNK